jgi:hypothetical protein
MTLDWLISMIVCWRLFWRSISSLIASTFLASRSSSSLLAGEGVVGGLEVRELGLRLHPVEEQAADDQEAEDERGHERDVRGLARPVLRRQQVDLDHGEHATTSSRGSRDRC